MERNARAESGSGTPPALRFRSRLSAGLVPGIAGANLCHFPFHFPPLLLLRPFAISPFYFPLSGELVVKLIAKLSGKRIRKLFQEFISELNPKRSPKLVPSHRASLRPKLKPSLLPSLSSKLRRKPTSRLF